MALLVTLPGARDLHAEGGGFDRAIATALPCVVKLYGLGAGMQKGFGTGVLISDEGLVLTVFSLLLDAHDVRAVTHDGTVYNAEPLYRDRQRQLALVQLQRIEEDEPPSRPHDSVRQDPDAHIRDWTIGPLPFVAVECPEAETGSPEACAPDLRPGDWVLAAGNAFKVADGAEPVSIAHGVFSARIRLDARRRKRDFPYTDDVLAIDAITNNPGAPGSILVDLDGHFVGLIGREVVSNRTHTHFNYAIPRDVLVAFLQEARVAIQRGESTPLAKPKAEDFDIDTGIRMTKAGYRSVLPFVERVKRNSPAAQAGVRRDDLILSVNGSNVGSVEDYEERLSRVRPGEPIELVIRRDRRILSVPIQTDGH